MSKPKNQESLTDPTLPWQYNQRNQLTSNGIRSYAYNAAGDMTTITSTSTSQTLSYNAEGRLSQFSRVEGGVTLSADYNYDPFNRRIRKEIDEDSDGTPESTIHFHYSDEGLIAEYDQNGNLLRGYGWQPGSLWGTDPVFYRNPITPAPQPSITFGYYLNDHLGTPHAVIDAAGSILWSAEYDTFGRAYEYNISTITQPLRFPGQYEDPESGLHYNWHRYYLPSAGRYNRVDPLSVSYFIQKRLDSNQQWNILNLVNELSLIKDAALITDLLSRDPIAENGGINLYGYVGNNPANYWDTLGLQYCNIMYIRIRSIKMCGIIHTTHAIKSF